MGTHPHVRSSHLTKQAIALPRIHNGRLFPREPRSSLSALVPEEGWYCGSLEDSTLASPAVPLLRRNSRLPYKLHVHDGPSGIGTQDVVRQELDSQQEAGVVSYA